MTGASAAPEELPEPRLAPPARHAELFSSEQRQRLWDCVQSLLREPTAPYAEDGPLRALERFAAQRPALQLTSDCYGNRILRYCTNAAARTPRLAFSAHLDHPGFLYDGLQEGKQRATFHGGVPLQAFAGAAVRFFELASGRTCATARVLRAEEVGERIVAELDDLRGNPNPGDLGMWELPAARLVGQRLQARVCDDLLGAAAILALFELLLEREWPGEVYGIFTRAEETGFVGCQGLLRSGALPKDLAVIGLECSPKRERARVGQGPVVRVGDRASVFDPGLTQLLEEAARSVAGQFSAFRWQRALMDGGRCETTAYNSFGVPAGGLCLALGNYHNVGANGRIAPEYVDYGDYEGLVALLLAATLLQAGPPSRRLQRGLDQLWQAEARLLQASAQRVLDIGPHGRRESPG